MAFLEEYTLLDELGQGGFATVYKVRHNELGYIRAVRVMNVVIARGEEDKTYQRFLDECRLLLRIGNGNHPNIVHICRPLLKDQRAAVEMDYVDGCDITKHVKRSDGFVPVDDVMRLLEEISSALAYCHVDIYRFCMDRVEDDLQDDPDDGSKVLLDDEIREKLIQKYRVIHNDIHSDNIIRREDGSYVLLDFGLAIQGENVVRSSRRSDGAPEFKAPEKWDGDMELTTQSDIYSFGVVLYEFLTGRVPFPLSPEDAGSAKAIYMLGEDHKSKTPDSIYELRKAAFERTHSGETYDAPDYPAWLEEVILKCLEKNPEDRFLNGKELHEYVMMKKQEDRKRLEELAARNLSDDVPVPVPVPVPEPDDADDTQEKPVPAHGSNRIWIISVIVLALLLVGAGVGMFMLWGARNADRNETAQTIAEKEDAISQLSDSLVTANEQIAELTEAAKPVVALPKSHSAIKYLDKNVWMKSDMEAYPELAGLWDIVNNYDYENFCSYFPLLRNSNNYIVILCWMKANLDNINAQHQSGKLYADNEKIVVNSYIFKLRNIGKKFTLF